MNINTNKLFFLMRYVLSLLLVIASLTSAISQADSTLPLQTPRLYNGAFVNFTTDNLGNLYVITSSNQIKKFNDKGDSIAVYNDVRRYGQIYSIDGSNPLKVIVYYKDFATIVMLDRLLNVRNTIDLRKLDIFQVTAVAASYDGNVWLFDESDSKIKKIDDMGKVLVESNDLRQVFDEAPRPETLFDRDGQLYLYDCSKGVFVFDYYGAQKNNYALLGIQDLQVLDKNTITGRDGSRIMVYKPQSLLLRYFKIDQPTDRFLSIRFTGNKLYALTRDGAIEMYGVK